MNNSHPEYVDCIVTEGEAIVYSGEDVIIVIITMIIIITLLTIVATHCSPKCVFCKQAQKKEQMQSLNLDLRLRTWLDNASCPVLLVNVIIIIGIVIVIVIG